ncbi:Propionate-CoA ligase [Pelomyxa schiedti]|nr:Propionate-CoA ligase [Pelomyxa schiedti]
MSCCCVGDSGDVIASASAAAATTMMCVPRSVGVAHDAMALAVAHTGGPSFTYPQLTAAVKKMQSDLIEWGIQVGDTIAIVIPNTVEFVVCYIGCTWARAVAAPLNSSYTVDEFKFYLSDAECKLVIVPPEGNKAAEEAALALSIPVCTATCTPQTHTGSEQHFVVLAERRDFESRRRSPRADTTTPPQPADFAMFLHTSGTTSKPKCVQLTHANLAASLKNIVNTYDLSPSDRTLVVMPLFHVHGLMCACLGTLYSGGCAVMPREGRFSASTFWTAMRDFRCNWFTAVPTIHQILLARADTDYNTPSALPHVPLRFIRSCSASLAPAVMQRLETIFGAPVVEAYAMTEAAHQMTSNPLPHRGERRAGSVGLPTGIQMAILDGHCNEVARGVCGEVCIKGVNVTPGYRNRPEANVEAFAGGWFHTGDQGFMDTTGYLTLTGRIKELINRGGEKISPLEVDAVLLSHPAVAEAVAFAAPDEKYGEEVNAVVVLRPGVTDITAADIKAHCASKLSAFKCPKVVHVATDIPRTATGKIQRRIVAAHFATKSS